MIEIRTISHDTPVEDLVWHRDEHDRNVTVLEGTDWFFQFDNQLPIKLEKDMNLFIGSMKYHRVIRGIDNLVINIKESQL